MGACASLAMLEDYEPRTFSKLALFAQANKKNIIVVNDIGKFSSGRDSKRLRYSMVDISVNYPTYQKYLEHGCTAWGKKSIATAPQKAIATLWSHHKSLDVLESKTWSLQKMEDVSRFTFDLFDRFQSGCVLAGFEKENELNALSATYGSKQGPLKSYYKKLETDAKIEVKKAIAEADEEGEI